MGHWGGQLLGLKSIRDYSRLYGGNVYRNGADSTCLLVNGSKKGKDNLRELKKTS